MRFEELDRAQAQGSAREFRENFGMRTRRPSCSQAQERRLLGETQHLGTIREHGRAAFGAIEISPLDLDQVCDQTRGGFAFALREALDLDEQCSICEILR